MSYKYKLSLNIFWVNNRMCKGGWLVYVRAPRDCPENMKLRKPILEKNKKDLEKMKIIKFNPFSPT